MTATCVWSRSSRPIVSVVADNIRDVMDAKGLNQAYVGAVIDRSQAATSRRLLGRIPFSIDELDKLAEAFNMPLSHLISRDVGAP